MLILTEERACTFSRISVVFFYSYTRMQMYCVSRLSQRWSAVYTILPLVYKETPNRSPAKQFHDRSQRRIGGGGVGGGGGEWWGERGGGIRSWEPSGVYTSLYEGANILASRPAPADPMFNLLCSCFLNVLVYDKDQSTLAVADVCPCPQI